MTRKKDLAEQQTDDLLEELEKKIAAEYSVALKEVQAKYDKFAAKFQEQDDQKKQDLKNGKITQDQYNKWRTNKLYTSQRYQDLSNVLAADLAKADQKAMSIANGYMPEAYAINYNYSTYDIEQNVGINTNFRLYSRETVEKLVKDGVPMRKVDMPKDELWNKQHINSAILQGVLQGDSIPSISKRLEQVTNMDKKAAIRNARTMMTGAQNSGRMAAYERADGLGIKIQKEWMATLDSRTRDSHQKLDGERVDWKKPFSNELMYPGDFESDDVDPSEVYNCRCTLVPFYPEYAGMISERMTYDEWAKQKQKPINYSNTATLKNYDECLSWAKENFMYEMEDLREGWEKVPSQIQAFDEFDKAVPHFIEQIKTAVDENDFSMRTDSNAIIKILNDGKYKSQIETSASKGYLDIEKRKKATEQLFNYSEPLDLADSDYEVYGYLDKAKRAKMYGDCRIVLKKENLIDRTTLTFGDSLELLENGADPFPSLAKDPQIYSWGQSVFSHSVPNAQETISRLKNDFDSIEKNGQLPSGNYVELQFHGGVTVEDIDYIEMPKSDKNYQEIEELAEKLGVKIKWKK